MCLNFIFIIFFGGFAWSFHFIPSQNGQWPSISKDFHPRFYPILFPILILEKEPVFPIKCRVLKKGTSGTMFITSLVWRGPWLGIEPGTYRTRSQHSTTRFSRRRYMWFCLIIKYMYITLFTKYVELIFLNLYTPQDCSICMHGKASIMLTWTNITVYAI